MIGERLNLGIEAVFFTQHLVELTAMGILVLNYLNPDRTFIL